MLIYVKYEKRAQRYKLLKSVHFSNPKYPVFFQNWQYLNPSEDAHSLSMLILDFFVYIYCFIYNVFLNNYHEAGMVLGTRVHGEY